MVQVREAGKADGRGFFLGSSSFHMDLSSSDALLLPLTIKLASFASNPAK